jgi:hypothetical protein
MNELLLMFILGLNLQDRLPREPDSALLSSAVVDEGFALEAPRQLQRARPPRRIFISGHSLVDHPFPEQLAQISAQLGMPLHWERHYLPGSSIRDRAHLPLPTGTFDTAMITEQHDVLSSLAWNDSQQQLRGWQDRMVAANPGAATFFYVPWLAMDDRNDPTRWIAYERAAFHVWQCINTQVNQDLASHGRTDRIATIPANLALAYLVGQMQRGARIPGMEGAGLRASVDGLFTDGVHLTPLGSYYVAVVSYMGMSGLEPEQPGTGQERFLADTAIRFFNSRAHETRAMRGADCQRYMRTSFLDDYLSYSRRSWWGALRMRRAIASSPPFK